MGLLPAGPRADSLADALSARVRRMAARLDLRVVDPPLTIHYYRSAVAKARAAGSMVLEDAGGDATAAHRVFNAAAPAGDGLAEAAVLLRRALGATDCAWLRAGATVWLADNWLGAPLSEWPGRLANLDGGVTARTLLTPGGYEGNSGFFTWPAAGLMVRAYLIRHGGTSLRELYRRSADEAALAALDPAEFEWSTPVAVGSNQRGGSRPGDSPDVGRRVDPGIPTMPGAARLTRSGSHAFERGICYAHAYNLDYGYASAASGDNLRYLRDRLHVNAISISPFGYIRGATDPHIQCPYRMRGQGRMGEENDESLISCTQMAHALGQSVMLAPHLWGRVWCGDWHAEDEAGWIVLFDEYRRFILHYAAVAQHAGCDALLIGKELGGTSGREAEWRELVAAIRNVYTGPLIYDANWNEEYRLVRWWDAVDMIGVSQYTPLSLSDAPTDAELAAGARAAADSLDALATRVGRRYLLAEVGFTAEAGAARNPWVESEGRTPDKELQARCYEAVLAACANRPRCAGAFWWKWFSHLESNNRGGNEHDFPPYGKPAEAVLARWYEKLARERG